MSIQTISTPSIAKISPSDAWNNGSNVKTALRYEPKVTHITLMSMLKDAIDYLDYNKTITGTQNFIDAVDYLVDTFPAMKLEEWRIIMTRLKAGHYGKMYERMKLPEIVEVFKLYEGERAEMMEQQYYQQKDEQESKEWKPQTPEQKKMWKEFIQSLDLPDDDTDEKGRWKFIQYPNSPVDDE